ncbi:MAG: SDR family oxidoreductase [Paracoccus sp. (in: a-proteobacteria)]|jgi:3-oxoacyl-[acyl-carrier protein] reductase|uniref:SDR family oxidoreductase n=1 Tax=unclassified Paracoccus (in: a-proteobacteria) TaxID=2688777 RepID=UPI000C3B2051|nr:MULTISPECIES: SDR family oxidoreductase [unclassified Paracoccus (in: a-proteobacteria)]MAN10989.1 short-chain dehydrogenase [Sphingobium sp.]MBA47421.1 short-chain dehydrogenase [Paracoccus sp. (in: a-proteobacteria)]MCS5603857.1 SDR family oxidoreductase [Paracoccus sp. (in: a-proteobacteria)]MDB2552866.1 SDR family oxidoreductase [Paracoccus sp. (in: a-proteobacteria)]|tara:strand:+ start:198 stop:977 length:780 start_codon:yes stop_codon:yes gene_type:complete
MDLGIKGKRGLVCAASRGLGRGCAEALAEAGVDLVINSRTEAQITQTARDIAEKYGVSVIPVAADITTEEGRARVLEAAGETDILVTNAGGPPPGNWTDWDRDDFIRAIDANMMTGIALMQALVPGMMRRGWGRVVNITSQSVRSPIPALGLSNTARAGLTGFVAGMSRQVAGHGVCVNNILPGIHATDRADSLDKGVSERQGISIDEARKQRQSAIPTGTYGRADDFGATCAFLCSQQARFIVGQNVLLDGGALNVTI